MSAGKPYVLDADVFIQAHQRHYAFDLCPGFWRALVREHEARRVFSIDKVRAELLAGNGRLSRWAKDEAPESLFKGTADKKVSDAFRDLMKWVQSEPQFSAEARAAFATAADGWMVAYAAANGLVVVTHEEYKPEAKARVPIPNVCVEFGVDYCDTFEMLRELKVQFVLRTKQKRLK